MDHALLPPSSAARVIQCPASLYMCSQYPEAEDNPKALEGTQAHEVNFAMLTGKPIPSFATEEMMDGADIWYEALRPIIESSGEPIHFEERVDCFQIHPDNWGTPDAWHYDELTATLRVWDYKFGHRHVEIYENWQLLNYAAGIWTSGGYNVTNFELTVVQPRSYHSDGPVRSWTLNRVDMEGYITKLQKAWAAALLPEPGTKTGKNCRDCSARHACPTLQEAALISVEMSGHNVPFDLTDNAIGRELHLLKSAKEILDYRIDGLENEVLGRIKQGKPIRGWMTKQGEGREKWNKPIDEVLALGEMMGIDIKKPTAITPKQAIKAGLPAELVRTYTEVPTGEIKLVPDDGNAARAAFNK